MEIKTEYFSLNKFDIITIPKSSVFIVIKKSDEFNLTIIPYKNFRFKWMYYIYWFFINIKEIINNYITCIKCIFNDIRYKLFRKKIQNKFKSILIDIEKSFKQYILNEVFKNNNKLN
jgi:hypothetical protein